MIFESRHKKKIRMIWSVLVVLIILSMIALSVPALFS
jgi:predicted nucleic acid-binding Zn ribbon protein